MSTATETSGSVINGKELLAGTLAGPAHAVGVGGYGPVLTAGTTGSKVVRMTIQEPWVLVELKADMGRTVTAPIPLTSFLHTVLAPVKK